MSLTRRHVLAALALLVVHKARAGGYRARLPKRTLLDERLFTALVDRIRAESFADERMEVLRQSADVHWLTCDQIVHLVPLFEWRADRVRVVETTLQAIANPDDRARIAEAFQGDDARRVRALLRL